LLLLKQLIESDFSAGKSVEVRTKVDKLGDVWAPAMVIKEDEDGTMLVKLKTLKEEEVNCTKISVSYSEIRPSPLPIGLRDYKLMENVDALVESGWCPGVVSKVLAGKRYAVDLGPNRESKEFSRLQLRPSIEWKDGIWHRKEKVLTSCFLNETTPLCVFVVLDPLCIFLENIHCNLIFGSNF